jgi:regulator of replication initiation timing
MNKDKQIEKLQKQLADARNENKSIKKENRKLQRELNETRKKKEVKTIKLTEEQEQFLSNLLNLNFPIKCTYNS